MTDFQPGCASGFAEGHIDWAAEFEQTLKDCRALAAYCADKVNTPAFRSPGA